MNGVVKRMTMVASMEEEAKKPLEVVLALKRADVMTEPIVLNELDPNLVRLKDGTTIDRAKAVFMLQEDGEILRSHDGAAYKRGKTGALKKLAEKPKHIRKMERKMREQYWRQLREQNAKGEGGANE